MTAMAIAAMHAKMKALMICLSQFKPNANRHFTNKSQTIELSPQYSKASGRPRQAEKAAIRACAEVSYGPFKLPIDNNFVSNSEGVSYPCILFSRS
jgi:hypothetical protein